MVGANITVTFIRYLIFLQNVKNGVRNSYILIILIYYSYIDEHCRFYRINTLRCDKYLAAGLQMTVQVNTHMHINIQEYVLKF